jgi:hypothetical protein
MLISLLIRLRTLIFMGNLYAGSLVVDVQGLRFAVPNRKSNDLTFLLYDLFATEVNRRGLGCCERSQDIESYYFPVICRKTKHH